MSSEALSAIAILLSAISLLLSVYNIYQDQANLNAESIYYSGWEDSQPYIKISLHNSGRRPIIIRSWGGNDNENNWLSIRLGEPDTGVQLHENEWHEFNIVYIDIVNLTPSNEVIIFEDLWVESSLKHRYKIKNAKENIKKLISASHKNELETTI